MYNMSLLNPWLMCSDSMTVLYMYIIHNSLNRTGVTIKFK